jgi:hypothetical protein
LGVGSQRHALAALYPRGKDPPSSEVGLSYLHCVRKAVTGYYYGMASYKASHAIATIFWPVVLTIWILIIVDSSTRVLCSDCCRDA